jgi:hypothetical protein
MLIMTFITKDDDYDDVRENGNTLIFIYMKRKAKVSSITQRYGCYGLDL